jgi:hypothetical protein
MHSAFPDELVVGVVYNPIVDKVLSMLHQNPSVPWRKVIDIFVSPRQASQINAILDHRIHYGLSFRHPWNAYLRCRDGRVVGFR